MRLFIAVAAAFAGFAALPAAAQDYPAKPIHVITATSPGGTSDVYILSLIHI